MVTSTVDDWHDINENSNESPRDRIFPMATIAKKTFTIARQQQMFFSARTTYTFTAADNDNDIEPLLASRLGLDPLINRFHAPIVYHERYSFSDWPPNHTFPMNKFERIAHALQTTCKKRSSGSSSTVTLSNLPRPIIRSPDDFFRPLDLQQIPVEDWFYSIIDQDFVDRFLTGQLTAQEARDIGFGEQQTRRPELIERTVLEVAGTILTCQLARRFGIAANVAGGTHHAHPTGGAGYTILNDLAVAANFLLTRKRSNSTVQRILVIDCDVHQGDGTAKFNIPGLFTLSLHCETNYPAQKQKSTFDVGIHDGCRDDEYLKIWRLVSIMPWMRFVQILSSTMLVLTFTSMIAWDV